MIFKGENVALLRKFKTCRDMSASFKKNPDGERHSGFGRDGSGVAGPTSYEIGLLPLFNWCEQRKTLTTKLLEREKGEE